MLTLCALLLSTLLLLTLSALPGLMIRRGKRRYADESVALYRDTHPLDEPEPAADGPQEEDLDAKWAHYWASSRAADKALMADLNEYLGWTLALEEGFEADCTKIVKRFTIAAVERQEACASAWGGWSSNIERRADVLIEQSGGNPFPQIRHDLAVELAEATRTGEYPIVERRELVSA